MSKATVDYLILEKIKLEERLKEANRRVSRLESFLNRIGLIGPLIGDGFHWEHTVSRLYSASLEETRIGDDLPLREREMILTAALSILQTEQIDPASL